MSLASVPSPLAEPRNGLTRVLHVVLSLDFGGMERLVVDLVREGQQLGQVASVVCLERPGTLAPAVEALGARVVCLNKPPGWRPEVARQLQGVFADFKPDVIHTHQIGALLYTGRVARSAAADRPVVHTEHISHLKQAKDVRSRLRTAARLFLGARRAARFVCVSGDIRAELRGWHLVARRKLRVILNGIETARFRRPTVPEAVRAAMRIPPEAPVVGTVGRLNAVKSQDVLIRAFGQVRKRVADAHLILVGDGPKAEELRALTSQLGLTPYVHFAGYQAEPERFLHAVNVFALPSQMEGTPLAALEAGASGLPVVATRVGGMPEVIEHGSTGFLIDVGDEAGLAKLLTELLEDPEKARRMGVAAQARIESAFDLTRMARQYHELYQEVLAERR